MSTSSNFLCFLFPSPQKREKKKIQSTTGPFVLRISRPRFTRFAFQLRFFFFFFFSLAPLVLFMKHEQYK